MNESMQELYVAVNGSDLTDGTFAEPFATIARAQDAAREAVRKEKSVRVLVREGTYSLREPLRFTGEDSGTANAPVRYEAYEGETVILSGTQRLHVEWAPYRDGIWQAHIALEKPLDRLFINGEAMHMARYPDYSPDVRIMNGFAPDCIDPDRVSRWADPQGGYVHAMHKHLWGDYHYRITGKEADGRIIYEGGWQNNRQMGMHEKYRYVENIFEELDAPGEWFYDRENGILYVYPFPDTDLPNAVVEGTDLPCLIECSGTEIEPVRHLRFQGITFQHTSRTFMDNREPLLRSDWTIYRGGAVLFRNAEDCVLENCRLDQIGGNGIFVDGYARRISIQGCHLSEIGGSGVAFVGRLEAVRSPLFEYQERQSVHAIDVEPGPQTDEYPSDCLVEDCLIYRTGRVEKQSAPVQLSMALRVNVRHCSIYDVPRAGINISEGTWGGHVIEYCDVFDTVQETSDHGAFNSWGRDRYWGLRDVDLNQLNPNEQEERSPLPVLDMLAPNILRNNRWRCDYGWDIDLDDGSSWYQIYNNLCLSGGIKLREGFYRICENNVMVNNTFHPHVWYTGSRDRFCRNLVFTEYAPIRVPRPWGTECNDNLLHVPGMDSVESAGQLQEQSGRDSRSLAADARFVDPQAGDFRVEESSPALALGFRNFPMDEFGVRPPWLKAIARTPNIPSPGLPSTISDRKPQVSHWDRCKIKNVVGLGDVSAAGLPEETGVWIESMPMGSWQMEDGLNAADVILALGDHPIDTVDDLLDGYRKIEAGESFALTIFRGQKEQQVVCRKRA